MEFWRGPAYTAFFEYLDQQGGFYYEVRSRFTESCVSISIFYSHSVGAMHLSIPSRLRSLLRATRSSSLMILGTSIIRIRIVPKTRMYGRKAGVRVILRGALVGLWFFFSFVFFFLIKLLYIYRL